MVELSEAIAADVATLGWNDRPAEDWVWVSFTDVAAWVHPEWVSKIAGATEEWDDTYSTLIGE